MPDSNHAESSLVVRRATERDLDVLGKFSALMALETEARELDPGKIRDSLSRVIEDSALGQMFIAEDRGEAVGSYLVNGREWSEWRNGLFYWVTGVYVVPEYRRKGVMFHLYRAAVEWVREQPDGLGLRAYVHRDNDLESLLGENTGLANDQEAYKLIPFNETPYVVIQVLVQPE